MLELSTLTPLTPFFGVRVSGFDVRSVPAGGVAPIVQLLAEKQIVVFKDQDLAPDDLLQFTTLFGKPDPHVLGQFSLPGYRDIYVLSNIVEDGRPIGNRQEGFGWHTDLSYREHPAAYTLLYALEVPASGGETRFASQQCLYDQMSEEEKAQLRPHTATWDYAKIYAQRTNVPPFDDEMRARTPLVDHPLVRIHPVSGRETLYVSGDGCAGMSDTPEEEGIRIVRRLMERIVNSAFTYNHRWEARDLVVWDNRGLMHTATDYDMEKDRRLVYRTSVRGERPIGAKTTAPAVSRRQVIAGAAAALTAGALARPARAADKIRFLTSWFAEAEHGGFYQAKATGLYSKAGLDVDLKMGGPQVNGLQLLTAGDADLMMGYDIQTLGAIEKGLPLVTVGASFQFDLQGMLAHADIKSLGDLKGHKVLVSTSAHLTFWPWLKERFGFSEDQAAAYTFNLQPFFADPSIAQQAYATSEPFQVLKNHVPFNFFLFAKYGWPPYGSTIVTTQPFLKQNQSAVARFVRATMEGWKSYVQNPEPGNALIKVDNPKMGDDQLEYSVAQLKAIGAVGGGDAARLGIGCMTEARWKATRDFMVRSQLLKDGTDWKSGFTTAYVKDLHITA